MKTIWYGNMMKLVMIVASKIPVNIAEKNLKN